MASKNLKDRELSEYRGYLQFLARQHLSNRYSGRLDYSDVVQQTLLQAHVAKSQFQGESELERLAWLRQILVRCISHATRQLHAKKRDIHRERSLVDDLDASSMRLEGLLADKESTPSQCLARQDRVLLIADAIESLPEEQKQIIVLRYWEEKSLREVADMLGKSLPAVAGQLHRATKKLRNRLAMDKL